MKTKKHLVVFIVMAILLSAPIVLLAQAGKNGGPGERGVEQHTTPTPVVKLKLEQPTYETITATVTAYSSTPDQTDDSPFITAYGTRVREGIVANNCLGFGEKVVIGESEYVVEDVGARRHGCHWFDIWMPTRQEALEWGRQEKTVTILR
jgi:3D (Asp-Asp-Asp) domain-containing protein